VSVFTLDGRSLRVVRVAVGVLLLLDLVFRAGALEAHYSDAGALPRDAFTLSQWEWAWSLHMLSGSVWFEAVLFALTFVALLLFTLGRFTFWSNLLSLGLVISMHARNPLLRDGQDDLARVLLFFFLFLPMQGGTFKVKSAGTVGITLQVVLLYWVSVRHKLVSPWWTSLTALQSALSLRRYQTPFAQWLLGFPEALRVLTVGALVVETLGPLLLLAAWNRPRIRLGVVVTMCGLHLGMWSCLRLGIFPLLCCATWLLFLPWPEAALLPDKQPRWVAGAVAAALSIVVALNVQNALQVQLPYALNVVARSVGLQQWWGVFAPGKEEGTVVDGWFWAQGHTKDGQLISLDLKQFSSSAEPPPLMRFESSRWRHLLAGLTSVGWPQGSSQWRTQQRAREALASWLCRSWNADHPEAPLTHLYLFWFRHELLHPVPVERVLLAQGMCEGG
jgi:hypothetical protein